MRAHVATSERRAFRAGRAYGITVVMLRFGTCPTAILVTSRSPGMSTTDTLFEPALATKARRPSGVSVTQSGDRPTSTPPSSFKSGSEYMYTALFKRLHTTSTLLSEVTAMPWEELP